MKLRDLRHACYTHGVDSLEDITLLPEAALFKGTYYSPSFEGQTWHFVAHSRIGGGISIQQVKRLTSEEL
jgi:hypothetical protein